MEIGVAVYCENADCNVLIYQLTIDEYVASEKNCPGCGQFGRIKGKQ